MAGRARDDVSTLLKNRKDGSVASDCKRGLLVDLIGIEPMTSSMPWKRAPSCGHRPTLGKTTPLSSLHG